MCIRDSPLAGFVLVLFLLCLLPIVYFGELRLSSLGLLQSYLNLISVGRTLTLTPGLKKIRTPTPTPDSVSAPLYGFQPCLMFGTARSGKGRKQEQLKAVWKYYIYPRSTHPCIPPGALYRVPASAWVG